jgi:hypothetical protein
MNQYSKLIALFSEIGKSAEMKPEVIPQAHQLRVAKKLVTKSPKMLVYHGLGTGKTLASILAAEAAKKKFGDDYGVIAPASLRENFQKEVDRFTTGSEPEILSYTGAALGKKFKQPPKTIIVDEAHRLRSPTSAATEAIARAANRANQLMLLSGSPIVNEPSDLATPLSMLTGFKIDPEDFNKAFIRKKRVDPGFFAKLRGIMPGERETIRNEHILRKLLENKVDYQPGKLPEGVSINEQLIKVPLTQEQQRIQSAIREKIPLKFLWKLDREFPLSAEESKRLNSFMTGLRQVGLSTSPFRADKNLIKSFQQSGKLTEALKNLKQVLQEDKRKKALIYSNYIGAGLDPYAAALAKEKIPYGFFHGGVKERERKKAVDAYNAGKLRALLIGPAGAEGLSTKGTSLIQILDPHFHESRTQQAKGRGLRFDSHVGLPEELKDVIIQKYISQAEEPSFFSKMLGAKKYRTGDEIIEGIAREKEDLNNKFREILKQVGSHHS